MANKDKTPSIVILPMNDNKQIPSCVDIETILIGQLLIDSESFERVKNILRPEMFYKPENSIIFSAIKDLFEIGFGINMMTVIDKLRKKNDLEKIGGAFSITNLTLSISSSAQIEYHAHIINQTWIRRYILQESYVLFQKGYEINSDIEELKIFIDELKLTLDFEISSKSNNLYYQTKISIDEAITNAVFYLTLRIGDRYCNLISENSMSMIYGIRGARKSTLIALLCGYIASGRCDSSFTSLKKKVKIFDTEQSDYYCQKSLHKIIGVSGLEYSENISMHCIKQFNKLLKRSIVEMAIAKDKPDFVVLDNIRHFVSDINNFKEAGETLEWLLYIQSKYKCHICCVIHQNKGDTNARGHLGAEIDTASEMTLRIAKDPENKMQSIITFEKTRDGYEPDDEILQVDENNIPSLIRGLSNADTVELFNKPVTNRYEKESPF